jgi:hypothetical protein
LFLFFSAIPLESLLFQIGEASGLALGTGFVLLTRSPAETFFPWGLAGAAAILAALHGAGFSLIAGFPWTSRQPAGAHAIDSWRDTPQGQRVALGLILAITLAFLIATLTASALFGLASG